MFPVMRTRTTPAAALLALAAALLAAGCGKTDDYRRRYFSLREETRRKIADLDAARRADRARYEQRLIGYEAELRRLRAELAAERQFPAAKDEVRVPPPAPPRAQDSASPAQALAALAEPVDPAAEEEETVASLLETFVQEYEGLIDEGRRAQFRGDFAAYLALLRDDTHALPASRRKDAALRDLRARVETAASERERARLTERISMIEGASAEDLPGVLDYYHRLDGIQTMNRLLDEYEIPREELAAAGIEPPPRSSWQPEAREVAANLRSFAEQYEAIVPPGMREQFRRESAACAAALSARPTDAEVVARRNAMLGDLRERAAAAGPERQERFARRIRELETGSLDAVRRRMQAEKLHEVSALVERYSIPQHELRESGVWYQRRRRR
jgi:hypothetical protein